MGAMVKGNVAKAGHDYMRRTYGEAVWQSVLECLSEDDRMLVEHIDSVMHYPVALEGRVFEALVRVRFDGDRHHAESELRAGGARQADVMLDGLFSVFARFVSPQQAFRRAGSVIAAIYSSDVTSSTEPDSTGNGGSIHLFGLGSSSFIAPWHCGWMERALSRFGAENARVTERNWVAGHNAADELVYVVHWT